MSDDGVTATCLSCGRNIPVGRRFCVDWPCETQMPKGYGAVISDRLIGDAPSSERLMETGDKIAATRIAELAELAADWKTQWEVRADMLDKAEAERDRLRAALEAIVDQMRPAREANWLNSEYIALYDRVRAVLAERGLTSDAR